METSQAVRGCPVKSEGGERPGRGATTVAASSGKGAKGGGGPGTQRTGSETQPWWTEGDLIRDGHHLTAVIGVQSIPDAGLNAKVTMLLRPESSATLREQKEQRGGG